MICGLDELDQVVRCIEMGAADYLPTPVPTRDPAGADHASSPSVRSDAKRLRETIERQRTELARFLSPQIAALVSSPEGEQLLAGHRRQVTALFCRPARLHRVLARRPNRRSSSGVLRDYHGAMGAIDRRARRDARALRR